MKRRLSGRALAGGVALMIAVAVGIAFAPKLIADPPSASPETLRRMAEKNERAAIEAAADLRDKSRDAAEATDALRAANEAAPAPAAAPERN
jgi:hypothetical protein